MQQIPPAKINELTEAQKSRTRILLPEGGSRWLTGSAFGERRRKGAVTKNKFLN